MPIRVFCGFCNKPVDVATGEYNRQIKNGRKLFFCNLSCSIKLTNSKRTDRVQEIEKICPYCNKPFKTVTGKRCKDFCSASCASAGSMTEKRREAQRIAGIKNAEYLSPTEETLRRRESWKYKKLKEFLDFQKERYEFEHRIGDYIVDLALLDKNIAVEFDGVYHGGKAQTVADNEKDKAVSDAGWKIIRKEVKANTVIESEILYDILKQR